MGRSYHRRSAASAGIPGGKGFIDTPCALARLRHHFAHTPKRFPVSFVFIGGPMRKLHFVRFSTLLVACLALAPLARAADRKPPDDVEFTKDVVYGKGGGQDLKLDLSRPSHADGKRPCILVFHGGGWAAGNKDQHDDVTWTLAERGYVSATVGYRFAPDHRFPAQVEDAKCAVRFLRAHADKYGIDSERIGAVGFSAGAHLSMMLGATRKEDGLEGNGGWPDQSSKVQAVVSFF